MVAKHPIHDSVFGVTECTAAVMSFSYSELLEEDVNSFLKITP